VEYLHKHKKSNICQREIGTDAPTFIDGLRNIFRQAPDVIVIGEMRDRETFRIALQAAGSGHLVLSTAHADSATAVIERIINMFEPHEQALIRTMLSECLLLSLSQRLVPKQKAPGRILALEKLINTHRLRKFIREGKTHQIRAQLQTGSEDFTSIDIELANLCRQGKIDFEDGLMFAEDKAFTGTCWKQVQVEPNRSLIATGPPPARTCVGGGCLLFCCLQQRPVVEMFAHLEIEA